MLTNDIHADSGWKRASEIVWRIGRAFAEYGLPFLIVFYLGLKGGGYDLVIRSELGIVIWWLVLLGAAVGVLPRAKLHPAAWVGLGFVFLFAAWTTIAVTWTEGTEQTMAEAARMALYLGVFLISLCTQQPGSIRRSAGAVGAAIVVVSGLALLSRLYPDPFPVDPTADFLIASQGRLNYPLGYWNGLATFAAMGIPLMLAATSYARHVAFQAMSAAAVPLLTLTVYYTLSRGGIAEAAIAVVALIVLIPGRLQMIPTLFVTGAGSILLLHAATQRDALADGLLSEASRSQGNEMLILTLVVCAGVGLLQAGIGAARQRGKWLTWKPSTALSFGTVGSAALVLLIAAIALGAPGTASDKWSEFKSTDVSAGGGTGRFDSAAGEGRYQFWMSAVDANETSPLTGIGPGTYEFWWARDGREDVSGAFVRDAHSLYAETLGELGIIGFLLLTGFIVTFLGTGAVVAFRRNDPSIQAAVAGATAAMVVFCVAAAIDWAWELSVLPVVFFLLAAGVTQSARSSDEFVTREDPAVQSRIGLAVLSLIALPLLVIPMASAEKLNESRDAFSQGELADSLKDAQEAGELQPYASSPFLQQALILEAVGDLDGAAIAVKQATEKGPTNWRNWLIRSRIEAFRGNPALATRAYERAKRLNPASPFFKQ